MLFSTINCLLRPIDHPNPADAPELCTRFLDFFEDKVNSIHQELRAPAPSYSHATPPLVTVPSTSHLPQCCLSSFAPVDALQVAKLVSKAKAATCSLDPMPSAHVKTCLPILCSTIVNIINSSLESGKVPAVFKIAAVTPIIKKPGLDPEDPSNYRPISNLPFLLIILLFCFPL
ncbi:hypothetical protein OYC64_010283 [Pagothenia borchgrevinki]|uniref:Uncharacterized protein n=1 Tax=Pagothenia borchgrevinki TaxID=8213 RepID=A0ABD2GW79_PAGBO